MSKQKSSSALVIEKLEAMGYGEVEVEKGAAGYMILCVNGIGEPIVKEFPNVGKINAWIKTIPDWTVEASEPEMSLEEYDALYGATIAELEREEEALEWANSDDPEAAVSRYYPAEGAPLPEGASSEGVLCFQCGELFKPAKEEWDAWGNSCQPFDPMDWVCPDCRKANRAAMDRIYEEGQKAQEKESEIVTEKVDPRFRADLENSPDPADQVVSAVIDAIEVGRLVFIEYQAEDGKVTQRIIRPFLMYEAESTGGICIRAYCTLRKAERTFRADRVTKFELMGKAKIKELDDGYHIVYPASYNLRRAAPQKVNGSKQSYLDKGWALQPPSTILRPSA